MKENKETLRKCKIIPSEKNKDEVILHCHEVEREDNDKD